MNNIIITTTIILMVSIYSSCLVITNIIGATCNTLLKPPQSTEHFNRQATFWLSVTSVLWGLFYYLTH